jgi:pimeloyl-ACP methyl ester carboxylesterase
MKPALFEHLRPDTVGEACQLLAADEGARIIAGRQTLVPTLAMQLALGVTTRQAQGERRLEVRAALPLLAKALPWVGHGLGVRGKPSRGRKRPCPRQYCGEFSALSGRQRCALMAWSCSAKLPCIAGSLRPFRPNTRGAWQRSPRHLSRRHTKDMPAVAMCLHQPILLCGARDPSTPPPPGADLVEGISGATMVTLDATHISAIEAADDFAGALDAFLTRSRK